jgi:DNA replication protein DnaC
VLRNLRNPLGHPFTELLNEMDFLAHAAKARWSAHQILEEVVKEEATERSRRSLERRLRISGIKSFKPIADFDRSWPAKIERDVIERALTLDFLGEARNLVLVGRNGLGKTMIAQNICSDHRSRCCKTVFVGDHERLLIDLRADRGILRVQHGCSCSDFQGLDQRPGQPSANVENRSCRMHPKEPA